MFLKFFSVIFISLCLAANASPIGQHGASGLSFYSPSSPPSPPTASGTPVNEYTEDKTFKFFKEFFDSFLFPANQIQAKAVNSSFFTENSRGRISLTRNFEGVELNTEYIFGLFSNITQVDFLMIGLSQNYTVTNFAHSGDVISGTATVDFFFDQLNFTLPIQLDIWFRVVPRNDSFAISEYDSSFRNFDRAYDLTNEVVGKALVAQYPQANLTGEQLVKKSAIESICKIHQNYCNGTNQQYESFDECQTFLSGIRLGKGYEGGRNTIFCRNIHQVMLPFRPDVHCPHIGKTGGDMCLDNDTTYFDPIEDYKSFFGESFLAPLPNNYYE